MTRLRGGGPEVSGAEGVGKHRAGRVGVGTDVSISDCSKRGFAVLLKNENNC
jgi:hypothetical protein